MDRRTGLRGRPHGWMLAVALTAAGALALAMPALAAGPNLIRDGGFEKPALSVPSKPFVVGQSIHKCIAGTARN